MGDAKRPNDAGARDGPRLSPQGEARRREREARLAEALRANLRRRKADLDSRGGGDAAPAAPPASEHEDR
jgi:hypothetical protein